MLSSSLKIGVGNNPCDQSQDRRFFEGHIDELRFWNRVLDPSEIQTLD